MGRILKAYIKLGKMACPWVLVIVGQEAEAGRFLEACEPASLPM